MHMDVAGIVMLSAYVAIVAGLVGAILSTKRERRRVELERLNRLDTTHAEEGGRLNNLERSVEAIAVELERVAEGQRFVTKLLADAHVIRALSSPSPRSPVPPARRHDSPPPTV